MKKPHPSIRVFQNPILERLTHVHPIVPLLIWGPITLYFLGRAVSTDGFPVALVLGIAALGLFFWTFFEYLLHRYIFHLQGESDLSKRLHFLIHGLHHDDPSDPTRLVMPPAGSIILGVILFTFFRAILGQFWVDPFFAGFLAGYLGYDYIHYATHHFVPRTRLGKLIRKHHMLHHFSHHESRWGVSSPIWDHVFGTLGEPARSHASARKTTV
jgi:sterol desaturase/sphingolipid hydroxylase (fatty acid hydroxylase superfamily)